MTKTAACYRHYQEEAVNTDGVIVKQRRCLHCSTKVYSITTSTDILTRHLKNNHAGLPPPRRSGPGLSSALCSDPPPAKRLRTTQSTLDSTFQRIDNSALLSALAGVFGHFSWAHRLIELPEFYEMAMALRSSDCPLPSRHQLRAAQLTLAQSLRSRVVRQLRNYCRSSPLTIAIDGWTNVNTSKVTNVVILCGGVAYYWCSIVNSSHHNTALWLRDPLVSVLNSIKAEGLIFTALVADNERFNYAVWELLLEPFPYLIRSPCAAHLVQLCVLKALSLPGIEPILTDMEGVLGEFRYKVNRLKLKSLQIANTNSSLNLLKPCDTRWSSQLYAADRLYLLRTYVDMVIQQTPQFWADLQQVIEFLKPFQEATDTMQKDSSNLYDTYNQFKILLNHISSIRHTSPFHAAKDDLAILILDLWEKHINLNAVVCCAILSFDESVYTNFQNKIYTAEQWFFDFAVKYAQAWNLSSTIDTDQLRRQVKSQWSDFNGRAAGSNFCNITTDVADFREEHTSEGRKFDARAVWNLHLSHAPVVAHAAVALLSISGSEAAVERTFSAQGEVHSDRRNRMRDDIVEAEMFIRFNERTVKAAEQWDEDWKDKRKPRRRRRVVVPPKQVSEMSEDTEEIEEVVSVRGVFSRPERKEREEKGDQPDEQVGFVPAPVAATVIAVGPPPTEGDLQAFIRAYVRDHSIHARFRWRDYHLQQLEAAAGSWKPPMKDTPAQLKRWIMQWVRNQSEEEEKAAEGAQDVEEEVKEEC
jgi:Protein of unknown function (DUF 659)/hAT family C-terminal dimerisation region